MTLYEFILATHNIFRWVAFILLLLATMIAYIGWFRKRRWTLMDRRIGLFTTIAIDIQLLLGLILYLFFSDFALQAILERGFSYVMGDDLYRQYAIEHSLLMLLAVIATHLGSLLPRKTDESTSKFRRAAIWFTIAIILILVSMPWDRRLLPF